MCGEERFRGYRYQGIPIRNTIRACSASSEATGCHFRKERGLHPDTGRQPLSHGRGVACRLPPRHRAPFRSGRIARRELESGLGRARQARFAISDVVCPGRQT